MSILIVIEEYQVCFAKKLDRYFLTEEERLKLIPFLETKALKFKSTEKITDCKDPNDSMILELAIASSATGIITGDKKHLITLHPLGHEPRC